MGYSPWGPEELDMIERLTNSMIDNSCSPRTQQTQKFTENALVPCPFKTSVEGNQLNFWRSNRIFSRGQNLTLTVPLSSLKDDF